MNYSCVYMRFSLYIDSYGSSVIKSVGQPSKQYFSCFLHIWFGSVSQVFMGIVCGSSLHFLDIYLLDEDALMNWLLKMFRMHMFRRSISLAENNTLLALCWLMNYDLSLEVL